MPQTPWEDLTELQQDVLRLAYELDCTRGGWLLASGIEEFMDMWRGREVAGEVWEELESQRLVEFLVPERAEPRGHVRLTEGTHAMVRATIRRQGMVAYIDEELARAEEQDELFWRNLSRTDLIEDVRLQLVRCRTYFEGHATSPSLPLAMEVLKVLVQSGFEICQAEVASGGVDLLIVDAPGVKVTWNPHDAMSEQGEARQRRVVGMMNATLLGVLREFGFAAEPVGGEDSPESCLVTAAAPVGLAGLGGDDTTRIR